MPLQTIYLPEHYTSNGSQTDYPFSWRILAKSDLIAITRTTAGLETVLTLDSDYTINDLDVNTPDGGDVLLTVPLPAGVQLFLVRDTVKTQLVNIEEGSPFPAATVTKVFDRMTMMIQELIYLYRQTLHFSNASIFKDITLTDPQANRVLAWNAAANDIENVIAPVGGAGITPVIIAVTVVVAQVSVTVTHNLGSVTARIIGFSSTFHAGGFKVVSQTTNAIIVELANETPVGGGTLWFEVAP